MLLVLFICSTIAVCAAKPFHKYPYVFLLDVGNEELEKTNTEQLRVSIPGGSLAMKYPVLGEGDTISHVRVSGIDFGTDLKVNIVGGGPGYKYVMLVFMGNPGVSYDAVVTLETLPKDIDTNIVNSKPMLSSKTEENTSYEVNDPDSDIDSQKTSKFYEVSDDDSDTDAQNDEDHNVNSLNMKQYSEKTNSEVMQSSSTFYNYANNEMTDDDKDDDSDNTSSEEEDDDSFENDDDDSFENDDDEQDDDEFDKSIAEKTYVKQTNDQINYSPREKFTFYKADASSFDDYRPAYVVDDRLYKKYQNFKPYFAAGFNVYPQSYIYNKQLKVNSAYNKEDPVDLEQMFNDEEVHNNAQYNDIDNSIDSDYLTADY